VSRFSILIEVFLVFAYFFSSKAATFSYSGYRHINDALEIL